jgi:hypothetical protein
VGAEAEVRSFERDLEKAIIRSPVDGVVLTRSIEVGQTVAASFTAPLLFTIAEYLKKMELVVSVAEADIGRVAIGQSATFSVDAWPSRIYTAAVKKVSFAAAGTHWPEGFYLPRLVVDSEYTVSTCCLKTHGAGGVFTMASRRMSRWSRASRASRRSAFCASLLARDGSSWASLLISRERVARMHPSASAEMPAYDAGRSPLVLRSKRDSVAHAGRGTATGPGGASRVRRRPHPSPDITRRTAR